MKSWRNDQGFAVQIYGLIWNLANISCKKREFVFVIGGFLYVFLAFLAFGVLTWICNAFTFCGENDGL